MIQPTVIVVVIATLMLLLSTAVTISEAFLGRASHHPMTGTLQQQHNHNKFTSANDILLAANFSGVATFGRPTRGSNNNNEINNTWSTQIGYLDQRFKVQFPKNPRYPVASNTKLYVAISLYQLQERGLVQLNRDVSDYVTKEDLVAMGVNVTEYGTKLCFRVKNQKPGSPCTKVTFAQLLDMSAGIADDYVDQFKPFPGSMSLVMGRYIPAFTSSLLFQPGTQYYYSNPSFMFGAWFVEKFSGLSFSEYIKKHITDPVGMSSTYFSPYDGKFFIDSDRVVEYYRFIDGDDVSNNLGYGLGQSPEFTMGSAGGAGGIISTQADERKLYYAMFGNFAAAKSSGGISAPRLSYQSLVDIIKPRTLIAPNNYYAQGLFIYTTNETTLAQQVRSYGVPETNPQIFQIVYEGEIMCSHTSNFIDFSYDPPAMAQVWSAVVTFYPTKQQYESVANVTATPNGQSFWSIVGEWKQQEPLNSLSAALIAYFMSS